MHKVVLWGAGEGYNLFTQLHGLSMVDVVAIVDTRIGRIYKSIDGIPVILPEELTSVTLFEYLIVCVYNKQILNEIIDEAVKLGIKREKIFPLRIFQIPFFNFDEYIQIKESNISILSDYCFAGLLYHRFGMEFTSPTINMFSDNENYFRFLSDIKGHLREPMIEIKDPIEKPYKGIYSLPHGRVGDSEWIFNHDIHFETAAARWKKGVERFNFDNYIVIMVLRSEEAAYRFDSLPIKNKIGFYWKELDLRSVVYMPEWNDAEIRAKFNYNFAALVNEVARENQGIRTINWMRALLHKDNFRRIG